MNWLTGIIIAAIGAVLAALGWTAYDGKRYRQQEREYYLGLAARRQEVLQRCSGPLSPVPAPWGSAPWEADQQGAWAGQWQPKGRHAGARAR